MSADQKTVAVANINAGACMMMAPIMVGLVAFLFCAFAGFDWPTIVRGLGIGGGFVFLYGWIVFEIAARQLKRIEAEK